MLGIQGAWMILAELIGKRKTIINGLCHLKEFELYLVGNGEQLQAFK